MTTRFRTEVTAVSPEALDLVSGGVLILFADGAPPELAEVSVLHKAAVPPTEAPPPIGARFIVGGVSSKITAMGGYAWAKIGEIGHVVINYNGGAEPPRPGEISVEPADLSAIVKALVPGAEISIED